MATITDSFAGLNNYQTQTFTSTKTISTSDTYVVTLNASFPVSWGTPSVSGGQSISLTSGGGSSSTQAVYTVTSLSSGSQNFTVTLSQSGGGGSSAPKTINFTVSASQDNTPENFSNFSSVTNAARSTQFTTSAQTISTISGNVAVSISEPTNSGNPQFSINGGTYTSSNSTIQNNQTIAVRMTSSSSYSTTRTCTLTIGTESRTFSITTGASGGGGSSVGGGTSSYGIEIYDTDGTTTVLSPSTRYLTAMNTPGSITIAANSSHTISQDMTGLTTSNSDVVFPSITGVFTVSVSRLSNGFQLTNNSSVSQTVTPIIIRF
tara:strand:+ start:566 stop:1525 length:960 start_codon:yes stop_codon:yes gene_type:complete